MYGVVIRANNADHHPFSIGRNIPAHLRADPQYELVFLRRQGGKALFRLKGAAGASALNSFTLSPFPTVVSIAPEGLLFLTASVGANRVHWVSG